MNRSIPACSQIDLTIDSPNPLPFMALFWLLALSERVLVASFSELASTALAD